ncbi:hypothetical protein PSECIP111854_00613 [Pseudoalteromonas sp. CIP111854]|uniref:DUF4381 domain-containing protein n=1 Tax=Pseudoalteromonas holothuriae TaxID=2963714 RepID=A0A9W4QS85_9GAMM|nr:DUF4381 domain-containing protein [Pseudoalteromonas sp. CIP111854]CAH9050832.1 hypothetical protein PSECIP111854_00613 [Pseudoalteromonas sp. CIP111854]
MQASPLDALQDVMPPSEVSWWPLSIAMWGVILLSLIIVITLFVWRFKAWRFKRAKREAIKHSIAHQNDAQQLHILLKRLTKHYYGTRAVASSNQLWASRLTQLCGQTFNAQELDSLYSPKPNNELAHKLHVAIKHFKLKEAINV